MSIVLVTSTGTDIGEAIGTVALAATLREEGREVHVVKPIQTGFPGPDGDDLDTVAELTEIDSLHGLERYPEPTAPVATAQRAGMRLPSTAEIAKKVKLIDGSNRTVFMKSVDGLLVRFGKDWALLELVGLLPSSQMVAVTRLGLGRLNKAEPIVEVVRGHGADVMALVGGSLPAGVDPIIETDLEELPRVTGVLLLGSVQVGMGVSDRQESAVRVSQRLPDVQEWTAGLQIEAARGVAKLAFYEKHAKAVKRQGAKLFL